MKRYYTFKIHSDGRTATWLRDSFEKTRVSRDEKAANHRLVHMMNVDAKVSEPNPRKARRRQVQDQLRASGVAAAAGWPRATVPRRRLDRAGRKIKVKGHL